MPQQLAEARFPQDPKMARPDEDYHARWHAFAVRRGLAIFLLSAWIPISVAFFEVSRHRLHKPLLFGALIFLWLAAALTAVWWAGEFRCPRCQRRYGALGHRKGSTNLTRGLFDKVCANCKLTKFERPERD